MESDETVAGLGIRAGMGASPTTFNSLDTPDSQPFKGSFPFLSQLIGAASRSTRSSRLTSAQGRGGLLFVVANFCETIMKHDVRNEGVQGGRFDRFETRAILLEDDGVATVQRPEKEHDHQERWNRDLAPRKLKVQAVKTRSILDNRLGLTLHIVEKQEEGREDVGN